MTRFTFQTVTDRSLFGPKCPSQYEHVYEMADKFQMRRTGTQSVDPLVHCVPNDCDCNVPAIAIRLSGATDPTQHRLLLPKLDILAVDADEAPPEEWEADDDVKGRPLVPREVKAARQKEIQYLWDMEVYEYSTEADSRARTGRNLVGFKWIDTNKGSAEAPRYRSRLVCPEVRHKGVEPIFSATPPLETLRILLCVACQEDVFQVEDPFLISITDVSRAHFYADAVRDVYVRLPDEDPKQSSQARVGNCERLCTDPWVQPNGGESITLKFLETGGFSRGVASPCHFFHKDLGTNILVHGADFFMVGRQEERKDALSLVRGAFEQSCDCVPSRRSHRL